MSQTPEIGSDPYSLDPDKELWGQGEVVWGVIASFLLSNIIGVIIYSAAGWKKVADVPMWGLGLLQIPLWVGMLAAVRVAGTKGSGVVNAFGVKFRAIDAPVGLLIGIFTQLVVLPLIYVPIFQLTGKTSEDLSRPARELSSRAGGAVSWLLFALLVGILAPIVEELFYRGLFLRALHKRGISTVVSVLVSSAIFGAIHLQPLQFVGLFLFGVVAAMLATVTRRLGMSIFAHIGFNMTSVLALYLDFRS